MAFNYSASQATALRLLEQFGQSVTRIAVTVGDYDPSTGQAVETETRTTRTGVLLNYGSESKMGDRYVNGNLVQAGDRKLLLDGTGAALLTDRYEVDGSIYNSLSITPLNPAGTVVMYEIHVRLS